MAFQAQAEVAEQPSAAVTASNGDDATDGGEAVKVNGDQDETTAPAVEDNASENDQGAGVKAGDDASAKDEDPFGDGGQFSSLNLPEAQSMMQPSPVLPTSASAETLKLPGPPRSPNSGPKPRPLSTVDLFSKSSATCVESAISPASNASTPGQLTESSNSDTNSAVPGNNQSSAVVSASDTSAGIAVIDVMTMDEDEWTNAQLISSQDSKDSKKVGHRQTIQRFGRVVTVSSDLAGISHLFEKLLLVKCPFCACRGVSKQVAPQAHLRTLPLLCSQIIVFLMRLVCVF